VTELLAQNPDELFDVTTPEGVPTGLVKRRADVHRDGDWHAAIHVWVAREISGRPEIIFQQRSLRKDTHGGQLDATVGGHLNAGERWQEAIRETEEEIGVAYREDDLIYLGRRIAVGEVPGQVADREIQHVFVTIDDRPLTAFVPNPVELEALVAIWIDDLLPFVAGETFLVPGRVVTVDGIDDGSRAWTRDDFPAWHDRYYYRVALAVRDVLAGERYFSI
jgi:isopentenyldiphosphate isomerase